MGMTESNSHLRTALRVLGCVGEGEGSDSEDSSVGADLNMVAGSNEECPLTLPSVVASCSSDGNGGSAGGGGSSRTRGKEKTCAHLSPINTQEEDRGKNLEEFHIWPAITKWLSFSLSFPLIPPPLAGALTQDSKRLKSESITGAATGSATTSLTTTPNAASLSQQLHRIITYLFVLAFESISREVLLRLKEYMKVTYGLTDERCASYCPLTTSSVSSPSGSSSGSGSGSSNVGRFAGEMGIPVGMHFEPLAPPSPSAGAPSATIGLFTSTGTRSPALWQVIKHVTADHNRMLLLLTEGGCDFNLTASAGRTRAAALRKNKKDKDPSGKKTSGFGKNTSSIGKRISGIGKKRKRKGVLERRSSLNSITEGDEGEGGEESEGNGSEDDDEYNPSPSHLRRISSGGNGGGWNCTTTPSPTLSSIAGAQGNGSGGGRSSGRKKQQTSRLGEYVYGDSVEEAEEEAIGGGGKGWKIDTAML